MNGADNLKINLLAGDLVILHKPSGVITTLLGSCVAIILHVPNKVTMACHALLPESKKGKHSCGECCPKPCKELKSSLSEFRFVTCSLKRMIEELKRLKIHPSQAYTYLVGGANILETRNEESIGVQNVRMAKEVLSYNGFTIKREHTGGLNGCNIEFYPIKNQLFVRVHGGGLPFELGDNFQPFANRIEEDDPKPFEKLQEEIKKMQKHFNK